MDKMQVIGEDFSDPADEITAHLKGPDNAQ